LARLDRYNPYDTGNQKGGRNRRSIRLKGYDYSQSGLYFITICIQNGTCLFGKINAGQLTLNDAGQMVETEWVKLPERFTNLQLHEYIIMPNHFHAIIEIVGAPLVGAQKIRAAPKTHGTPNNHIAPNKEKGQPQGVVPTGKTLGEMIGAFKSITTVAYIRGVKTRNWQSFERKLWQRNYWEHIIRTEKSYQTISAYIINNPLKWEDDKFYFS